MEVKELQNYIRVFFNILLETPPIEKPEKIAWALSLADFRYFFMKYM